MAKRRNVRVLLGRGAGIVARAGSGNSDRRRNSAYALSAKRIRYHDAGLAGRRSAARSHRHRTTPFMKRLVAMDDVRISTYDNAAHLSAGFLKKVRELYEGTRLGRQELQGAMILDPQNALFKDDWLIHDEVAEDLIEQVTVG